MTDDELDEVYTALCHALTRAGEATTPLLLARFALLAMQRIDDRDACAALIAAAAEEIAQ